MLRTAGEVPPMMVLVAWNEPPLPTCTGVPSLTTVTPSVSTPRKLPVTISLLLPTKTSGLLGLPARQSPFTVEPKLSPVPPHPVGEQSRITASLVGSPIIL